MSLAMVKLCIAVQPLFVCFSIHGLVKLSGEVVECVLCGSTNQASHRKKMTSESTVKGVISDLLFPLLGMTYSPVSSFQYP